MTRPDPKIIFNHLNDKSSLTAHEDEGEVRINQYYPDSDILHTIVIKKSLALKLAKAIIKELE